MPLSSVVPDILWMLSMRLPGLAEVTPHGLSVMISNLQMEFDPFSAFLTFSNPAGYFMFSAPERDAFSVTGHKPASISVPSTS